MSALIRCCLHLTDTEMGDLLEDEDKFFKAWGQVSFYLKTVKQVEFN